MKLSTALTLICLLTIAVPAQAWIADIDSIPEYCEDCIQPLKVEIMDATEKYQTVVILSMLFVNMLKTIGMYYLSKRNNPEIKFNPSYAISALLGVYVGYNSFLPMMTYEGTYINIFMYSGFFALGANLMFDFTSKVKENFSQK